MHRTQKLRILSSGICLPSERVKSDDLLVEIDSEKKYGIPTNWISETMGIRERRMAKSECQPSELAIPAALQAIDCSLINTNEIGLIVFCGIERDQSEPATAHTIQNKLKLNASHVFDVSNACFGFIDGLEIANAFIRSGITNYGLVVTGEVPGKILRAAVEKLKRGVDEKTARKTIGALSVGDAGGAVIVGLSEPEDSSGFELFNTTVDSAHGDKCKYRVLGDGSIDGQMLMGPISKAIVTRHEKLINDTLERLGWSGFDWMLTHQMGKRPFEKLAQINGKKTGKMIKTFDTLGNITSATFPVNFHKLTTTRKLTLGDRIGGCFAGSGLAIGQFGYTY